VVRTLSDLGERVTFGRGRAPVDARFIRYPELKARLAPNVQAASGVLVGRNPVAAAFLELNATSGRIKRRIDVMLLENGA